MDGFRHGHGRATISPRNAAAAAQFDEGMWCTPQVGRTTCVGGMCGDGLRNQQADVVARGPQKFPGGCNGQDDGWDNDDDDVGTVGTLTTTEAGEISEDDDDEDEDCVPCHEEDEADDVAREDATHEACMQQCFEKNRQKHGDGEPEMGAVDDAEDDDAPHFHFLKKAGIEAADSGKIRAVLAECWRALSVNISDGNNKKKPRTTEFIHHNTSTKGTLLEHNREEDGMTDDDIKELCKACSNLLHTLDATCSRFLKWHMKWDDEAKKAVRELGALIASALKQARAIGVSMTPKWHLLEDHILDQHIWLVKNGWGGICWLDESFVERAHQEGVKEDRRTQGVKGYEAQQTAQFKAEERASNPKVEERRERNSRGWQEQGKGQGPKLLKQKLMTSANK